MELRCGRASHSNRLEHLGNCNGTRGEEEGPQIPPRNAKKAFEFVDPHAKDIPTRIVKEKGRNLLLIGVTQSGKSTLGNFLLAGATLHYTTAAFLMGDSSTSCTKNLQSSAAGWRHYRPVENEFGEIIREAVISSVNVIDSPGVGDTVGSDQEVKNMLKMYQLLAELRDREETLSCIVLVVGFGKVIDEQYRNNLRFYKSLFPRMFEQNVALVVTSVEVNEKWQRKKRRAGNDPEHSVRKIRDDIQGFLGLNHQLPTFYGDFLAEEDDEEDFVNIHRIRRLILNRCFEIPGVNFNACRFPKPVPWMKEDKAKIEALEQKKIGIVQGIKIAEASLGPITSALMVMSGQIANTEQQLISYETELTEKNCDDLITLEEVYVTDSWHLFKVSSDSFDITTKHDITDKRCTGGVVRYTVDSKRRLAGTVKKGWLKSLNATVTVSTTHKIHYEKRIAELQVLVHKTRSTLSQLNAEYAARGSECNAYHSRVADFKEEQAAIEAEIAQLKTPDVSIDEMTHRIGLNPATEGRIIPPASADVCAYNTDDFDMNECEAAVKMSEGLLAIEGADPSPGSTSCGESSTSTAPDEDLID